jgi:REP element-mobilizing transposase RayT
MQHPFMRSQHPFPKRKSIRLKDHDYSSDAFYFITLVVEDRQKLFGTIHNNKMQLNAAGSMITEWYYALEKRYPDKICHAMIVMPDHFHCIIQSKATAQSQISLAQAIGWFKTITTNAFIKGVKEQGWPKFPGRLWQRNYYERIIRTQEAYENITRYIRENPEKYRG